MIFKKSVPQVPGRIKKNGIRVEQATQEGREMDPRAYKAEGLGLRAPAVKKDTSASCGARVHNGYSQLAPPDLAGAPAVVRLSLHLCEDCAGVSELSLPRNQISRRD